MLNDKDNRFLTTRARLVRFGRPALIVLILLLIAGQVYLWFRVPMLGNPPRVLQVVRDGNMNRQTMELLAVIGSLSFFVCYSLLVLVLVSLFSFLGIEKHYLAILRSQRPAPADEVPNSNDPPSAHNAQSVKEDGA